jgi:Tfp pilus assembly protein PilF
MPDHPDVANSLNNLGVFYLEEGKRGKAEEFFRRAAGIRESRLWSGPEGY